MASALALTYLSLSEGFGLPLLEAMNTETPILAADATALPEIAGNAALLVDPFDEIAIADGLQKLYTDPGFAQNLVLQGRQQRGQFSWDTAAQKIYTVLQNTAR